MINYGRQLIDEDDIHSVVETLRSDYLTQGPSVRAFEEALAEYTGAKYCVAVANGTAALHLAVAALQLPADGSVEGITSPITFAASANCMPYCGIVPRFADIEPVSRNVSVQTLQSAVTEKTRLLIPVHFAGQPCDMPAISRLAQKRGLRIIEDAAHAIGSSYPDGDRVGSCRYSDMTIFSFHPVKTITTGEGGAVTTNDPDFYQRLCLLRNHGITKEPQLLSETPGPWFYEMQDLGWNYRLTDIQAALGKSQLTKLEQFKARRRQIIDRYNRELQDIPWLVLPREREDLSSCFHLYAVEIDYGALKKDRTQVMAELRERGIGTQVHYIPVHTQPYYRETWGMKRGDFPAAEAYYARALSLPLYPAMTEADAAQVIRAVKELARG